MQKHRVVYVITRGGHRISAREGGDFLFFHKAPCSGGGAVDPPLVSAHGYNTKKNLIRFVFLVFVRGPGHRDALQDGQAAGVTRK